MIGADDDFVNIIPPSASEHDMIGANSCIENRIFDFEIDSRQTKQ